MMKFLKKKTLNTNLIEKYYPNLHSHLEYKNEMIYEHFLDTAKEHPNYIAYEYFGREVTYQKFVKNIEKCAKALKAIGVMEGDVVTLCLPNMPEAIIMFYAINMIGAISNIIHPLSSENEILDFLKLSNSKVIITIDIAVSKIVNILSESKLSNIIVTNASENMKFDKKFLYYLARGRKMHLPEIDIITMWQDFLVLGDNYIGPFVSKRDMNDPAVILYSGGTTGIPKGILLSNLNFNALAMQAKEIVMPKPKEIILAIMPIFHGFGLGVCLHTTLCVGMKCILIPEFNHKKFKKLIKKYHPNFIVGVPTLFEALTNAKFKKNELSCITNIISGGDTLNPNLKKKIDDFLMKYGSNAKVRVGYGLTESTAATVLSIPTEMREGCIGIPFPDMECKIVKPETHIEVENNTEGEICFSGPTVMLGYLNETKETMQTLRKHEDGKIWLHTGDMGYKDDEGMIFFKQRIKRIIISSGYNLYPSYIESVIDKHPSVNCSVVIGIPHPYKVQVAKAFIVLNPGYKPNNETLDSIKKFVSKNIAKYSLPYQYEFIESIPKTKIGKVDYASLEKKKNR